MANLFDEANQAKPNFFKAENIGDSVQGVYVDRKIGDNRFKPGEKQVIYTLVQEDGTPVFISGRRGNPAILPGMEVAKFGEIVGIRYDREIENTKGGFNAKAINVYTQHEMDEETLKTWRNMHSPFNGDVQEAGKDEDTGVDF